MATVRLGRYDVEPGGLPQVCMACGAPASVCKSKKFRVYVLILSLPLMIVPAISTKGMTLTMPFCNSHKRYFYRRSDALAISLLLLIFLGCGGSLGLDDLQKDIGGYFASLYALAFGFLFLGWVIFAAVLGQRSIRATEITDNSITLVNVSEEFAKAAHLSRMEPLPEEYPDVLPVDPKGAGGSEQYYRPSQ